MPKQRPVSMKKGQIWYPDFIIAILLFTLTLIIFTQVTTNLNETDMGGLGNLQRDAFTISTSLMSKGAPENWNETNAKQIGLLSEDGSLNITKARAAKSLYETSQRIFGVHYDYLVLFKDKNGNLKNIGGTCAIGTDSTVPNISSARIAYYYSEPGYVMGDIMSAMGADIYAKTQEGRNISDLMANVSNYDLIFFEDPKFENTSYPGLLEDYTEDGGIVLLTDKINQNFSNIKFYSNPSPVTSTITNYEHYLNFTVGLSINQAAGNYVEMNRSFLVIATNSNGNATIAKYSNGKGMIYYISDMNATENIVTPVTKAITDLASKTCTGFEINTNQYKKLTSTSRLAAYDGEILKIEVYVWEK